MIETGRVVKVDGKIAEVIVLAKPECQNCELCLYVSSNERKVIAVNSVNAKVNDKVRVFVSTASRLKISTLFYILPLFLFFIFYMAYTLYLYKFFENKPSEILSAVAGFLGIFLSFVFVRIYNNIFQKRKKIKNYIIK